MAVRIEAHAEPIPGYRLLDRLGSGGFGEVWRAEAPGGIFKAIKIIHGDLRSRDHDLIRYAEQELKALKRVKQVRHPYLLALDRFDIVEGRLMIVMELADCNLWDRFRQCRDRGLPGIPRDELLMYMAEAAEVLDLMNDQFQLQHLDVKPQNLFLLYHHVKVADFGQVKDLQGMFANVTGGITPVYAAPETFDGIVSKFCDQYSLACVYQELLTGVRPFDGSSMSHLLMQHLQLPPDLAPSPPCDRPALLRALAKRPEDRWPNVSSFVRALREAGGVPISGSLLAPAARIPADPPTVVAPHPAAGPRSSGVIPSVTADTPEPPAVIETGPPVFTPAPPEVTGDGPVCPAVVIGLGQAGLRVLQRLRFDLAERYGPPESTPAVRTLYIDTDPDAAEPTRGHPHLRLAGLNPDEVFAAKLNRAGHYLKPRLNGRSLTEGWFDPQLLYKIPRVPQTMGLRLLGRLAFCDHYRPLMGKVQAELDACLNPDALRETERRTGLKPRTNRPRVYVVAGLAGGTGGGMFLDLAYSVRVRLRRLGYEAPEVVGLLFVPPADLTLSPPTALANTYAALTELNHYARPDTVFTAHYDDRHGSVREKDPPFTRCYLIPGPVSGWAAARVTPPVGGSQVVPNPGSRPGMPGVASGVTAKPASREGTRISGVAARPGSRDARTSGVVAKSGSREMPALGSVATPDPAAALAALKPYADAAELIRLNLFTPVGRAADEARAAKGADAPGTGPAVRIAAFGLAAFDWPRAEVLTRTTERVARAVLKGWVARSMKRAREVIPAWAAERWPQLGLDPEAILAHLNHAADVAAGGRIEELIGLTTEPLVPRGWLGRLPEPEKVVVALDRLVRLIGPPASPPNRPPTPVEHAVAEAVAHAVEGFTADLRALGPALIEDPQFRLAGAEEALRQLLATTDRLLERHTQAAHEQDTKAVAAYECLADYAHTPKGGRKPAAAAFTEAVRQFPRARFQALLNRHLTGVYKAVREVLSGLLNEVTACRARVEAAGVAPDPAEAAELPPGPRRLMPPGCPTVADAVYRFVGVLADADLAAIDARVQAAVAAEFGSLYEACLNSGSGAEGVLRVLRDETRAYLEERLGAVDLAAMFADRFGTQAATERAIGQAFQEAGPDWVGDGPWAAVEVAVLAAPPGQFREVARRSIPVGAPALADTRDDLTVYREYPAVPLSAVPHLGPAAAAAYQSQPEATQCSPHARLDVTHWADPDAD